MNPPNTAPTTPTPDLLVNPVPAAQPAPQLAQPQVVQPPQPAPVPAPVLTEADVMKKVEAARAQEKSKLYGEIEELRQKLKAQEDAAKAREKAAADAARAALPEDARLIAEVADLRNLLEQKDRETRAALEASQAAQMAYQLSQYRDQVIRQNNVPEVVQYLVGGNSPEQIMQSVGIANAEYAVMRQHFAAQFQQPQPPPVAPPVQHSWAPQATPYTVPQPQYAQQPQPQQVGITPTAPAGAPGPGHVDIASMTSHEAIRNGTYLKHREAVHAFIRQGSQPVPTAPGYGMPPQVIAGYPAMHAPQYVQPMHSIPQAYPQTQYAQMPGGVMQPMGLPTSPVHPQAPQQTPMGVPNGYPQQPPAQQMGNQAMMAQAAEAVQRAMANPQAAMNQVGSQAQALGNHPEYHQQNAQGQIPQASQLMNPAAHPMIRN